MKFVFRYWGDSICGYQASLLVCFFCFLLSAFCFLLSATNLLALQFDPNGTLKCTISDNAYDEIRAFTVEEANEVLQREIYDPLAEEHGRSDCASDHACLTGIFSVECDYCGYYFFLDLLTVEQVPLSIADVKYRLSGYVENGQTKPRAKVWCTQLHPWNGLN